MWKGMLFGVTTSGMLLVSAAAQAADLTPATPEEVGLSSAKLEVIDTAMQRYVDDGKLPGIITVVARNGKIAHVGTNGQMNVEDQKPMRRDAILRLYSMTKPVTAVALMSLYEEGKFKLDDPVSKYLAELKDLKVYEGKGDDGPKLAEAAREMTVRDLMRHTAGLTYVFVVLNDVDRMYQDANVLDPASTLEDMVTKLGKIPLLYQPGERWVYSVASDVQGRLVEVLCGKTLDEFFAERIFEPLGMKDTAFHVGAEKLDRFAANYGPKAGAGLQLIDVPGASPYASPPGLLSGGGGLVSTADDYLRFAQMMLGRGQLDDVRILNAETVDLMTKNHLPEEMVPIRFGFAPLKHTGYGLGVSVRVNRDADEPAGMIGEYGWFGAASTFFFISPEENLIGMALTQHLPPSMAFYEEFRELVYEAIVERN